MPVISKLGLTVPVVYVFSGDPVSAGFADSLARPRGNMTGLTFMAAEFNGKRLELLRDIMPELRRVAIVANPAASRRAPRARLLGERGAAAGADNRVLPDTHPR